MKSKMVKVSPGKTNVALNLLSGPTGPSHNVPQKRGDQAEEYRKLGLQVT